MGNYAVPEKVIAKMMTTPTPKIEVIVEEVKSVENIVETPQEEKPLAVDDGKDTPVVQPILVDAIP